MKNGIYQQSDMVKVLDTHTNTEVEVPKAWLASNSPYAGSYTKISGARGRQQSAPPPAAPSVPAVSSTREELEQFAAEHAGMTAEEAGAFPNKEALHAALTDKAAASGA